MNYHHAYHSGSFADVVKHVILTAIITSLGDKSSAFCYLDTHAGMGYYDLFSDYAAKNKEYAGGIGKIIQQENPPPLIESYLTCVRCINKQLAPTTASPTLRYYPGSAWVARHLCRAQDRIIACELQPQVYRALKAFFAGDKQVSAHHVDGFLGLKAFLPPHERRGLVLVDPPYENPEEWTRLVQALTLALKRWATGCYAIWYPLKEKIHVQRFHTALKQSINRPILISELSIHPDLPNHLNGCGLAIINPPWKLGHHLEETLPWLRKTLSTGTLGIAQSYSLN